MTYPTTDPKTGAKPDPVKASMKASICIASMGRPSLLKTVQSVKQAIRFADEPAEIIIADDSKDGAVARLLAKEPSCRIVPVGQGNVSLARNACLEQARGDWIVFVDDDEYVAEDWLSQFLALGASHQATVVLGPVYHNYPPQAPDWFHRADPLFQDFGWAETGRQVNNGRTGNTLVKRAFIEQHGLRFDPDFGRSGGEDHAFFNQIASLGGKMIVTDLAKVWEDVPLSRCSREYILQRSRIQGMNYARVELVDAPDARLWGFGFNALAKLALASVSTLAVLPLGRARILRMGMKAASNLGKLHYLLGHQTRSAWD